MAQQSLRSAAGQFGYPKTRDALFCAYYNADATPIPLGNLAAYNVNGDAVNSLKATSPLAAIGIAYETIPVGKTGLVVVQGLALANIGAAAVAANALLQQSTATDGQLFTAAVTTVGNVIAIALTAIVANGQGLVEVGKM
ncbi:MAG: hypothetical protein ACREBW_06515 [Candidatus Micrarchaeaceae archaeon]